MSKEEIPKFKILDSIQPKETEGGLHSPELEKNLEEYREYETRLWNEFLGAKEGSSEEEAAAKQLAELYFLETANKQQLSPEKAMWSDRFNELAGEIYGKPELNETAVLAEREMDFFSDGDVKDIYEKIASYKDNEDIGDKVYEKLSAEQFSVVSEGLQEYYAPVLEKLEEFRREGKYKAEEVKHIFEEILHVLEDKSPLWSDWNIVLTKGNIHVAPESKEIHVKGLKDFSAVQRMVMHEIGVHAARSVAGYEKEDEYLAYKSLPGSGRFEEGLGVFFEYLITGDIPDRVKNRYIDAAIAFGVIPDLQMTREELIDFATQRAVSRREKMGEEVDEERVRKDRNNAKIHINRLFRGGDGNMHNTPTGLTQSVFVKDIIYYLGVAEAEDFVKKQLDEGKDPKETIDYLLQGKFDPANEKHIEYLNNT